MKSPDGLDLDELFDLRVNARRDTRRPIRGAASPAKSRASGIHHAHERNDSRRLAAQPFTVSPIAHATPIRADAAACEASQTFSFQVSTMPSRLSGTELRKHEIGRPRAVPPFDRTGVAGMNHSRDM